VAGAKVGIIIIHGIAEHKGRYEEFADRLYAAGISVFAPDLRGHGESSGTRGHIESFDDYMKDLDAFIRHTRREFPELKLAVFGHSIGGLIAAAHAAEYGGADFLVLSSPALDTPRIIIKILHLLPRKLFGKLKIKKRISESKDMLKYSRNDMFATNFYTIGLLKSAFIDGVKIANAGFGKIKIPVLMLGGKLDNTIRSDGLGAHLENFGSIDKNLIIYDNAIHRVVQNNAKDKAIPDIINWIKGRI
jgi:lysophospholipase